ncbi:MAG: TlyA family RNA methyltransferase [Bacteroides sp.]|nr:TlyA family RNA methyltransferase [Bacillota bacterium]MCM1394403.1 TlyA family RNA methyltransferase [[Eubacterium] siraeum]MCM1455670.1 TlyA family RNA methyltransferase [Bacteroides sp.]
MRLDRYLQITYDMRSRTYAENLIKTGGVFVNGNVVVKPSYSVNDGDVVEIFDDGYASQGAYKLEEAFLKFGLSVTGKVCADIGCSNGGFTDCLLRRGAKYVYAVDVAECALNPSLLESGKVKFIRSNARELLSDFHKVDFVCSDVSFISLKLVLPEIFRILNGGGEAVVLVKPQFELDKSALGKSGIVTNEKLRVRALDGIKACAISLGFQIVGIATSPIRYQNKNIEYLLYVKKTL